jgi:hypothetical protein
MPHKSEGPHFDKNSAHLHFWLTEKYVPRNSTTYLPSPTVGLMKSPKRSTIHPELIVFGQKASAAYFGG